MEKLLNEASYDNSVEKRSCMNNVSNKANACYDAITKHRDEVMLVTA